MQWVIQRLRTPTKQVVKRSKLRFFSPWLSHTISTLMAVVEPETAGCVTSLGKNVPDSSFLGISCLLCVTADGKMPAAIGVVMKGISGQNPFHVQVADVARVRGKGEEDTKNRRPNETLPGHLWSPKLLEVCRVHLKQNPASDGDEFLLLRQDALHCFKVRQCYVLLVGWACSNYMPPWLLFGRLIRTIFKTFVDHSSWTLLYVSKSSMIYPWNYWLGTASFFQCMFSLAYNFN